MTQDEIKVALALGECSYLPDSFEKRFAFNISRQASQKPYTPMTDKGRAQLWKQAWRYRRQLPPDVLALVPVPPGQKPYKKPRRIRAKAGSFFLKASV